MKCANVWTFGIVEMLFPYFIASEVSEKLLYLSVADESVIANLRNKPENREDIFNAIRYYKTSLYKVYQIVLHHDRFNLDDAAFVYKLGKPRFLDESIDMKSLGKLYEWDQGHFTALELLNSETKRLWDDFVKQYELLRNLYNL